MNVKGLGWKFLAVVFIAALLTSGTWVKAANAARLTHHELTLKDEKGKPLGQSHCAIHDKEGNYLANVVASVDGLIVAMARPGATLRCVSKELKVHEGEVKAGRKIVTMKQPLRACWACDIVGGFCCLAAHKQCKWIPPPKYSEEGQQGQCVSK